MEKLNSICESVFNEYQHLLSSNDKEFFKRVYFKNQSIYLKRLKKIGFSKGKRILDAGCGFGQWTVQMTSLYDEVNGVDIASERLFLLKEILQNAKIKNVRLFQAELANLPFKDNYFSEIFSYGAIFLSPWKEVLKEFCRILKKGGRIYFTANGLGWYTHLWKNEYNKVEGYNPRFLAAKTFMNTYQYSVGGPINPSGDLIIEEEEAREYLSNLAFSSVETGSEGALGQSTVENLSFFQAEYEGQRGIFEMLAKKEGQDVTR